MQPFRASLFMRSGKRILRNVEQLSPAEFSKVYFGLMVVGEVLRHFLYGSEPASLVMIVVGAAAVAANVNCLWLLLLLKLNLPLC
jgi:hypothetical protein